MRVATYALGILHRPVSVARANGVQQSTRRVQSELVAISIRAPFKLLCTGGFEGDGGQSLRPEGSQHISPGKGNASLASVPPPWVAVCNIPIAL